MIQRLKRQTKKRHSVRAQRFVTFRSVHFKRKTVSADLTTVTYKY